MRLLRCLLVSGSAAMVAGSVMIASQAAVTTAAAPGRAAQPSAQFVARARAALLRYLETNKIAPPVSSGGPGSRTVDEHASATSPFAVSTSYNWSGYADSSSTPNT